MNLPSCSIIGNCKGTFLTLKYATDFVVVPSISSNGIPFFKRICFKEMQFKQLFDVYIFMS